jgi:hypothetical protein
MLVSVVQVHEVRYALVSAVDFILCLSVVLGVTG